MLIAATDPWTVIGALGAAVGGIGAGVQSYSLTPLGEETLANDSVAQRLAGN